MSSYEDRLKALREQLKADRLDGFVVPISDEHMSEYVGDYAQRLAWLTGFKGSAGSAVVLPQEAAIFTDGRYTLQVREQVDGRNWAYVDVPATSVSQWLGEHAPEGARIGFDPWLHTLDWAKAAEKALAAKGATLVPVVQNPIDAVWADQPEQSDALLFIQDDALAGKSAAQKRAEIADWLESEKADAAVLTALDSVAWAFNIRGADIANTPVALSYAVVNKDATADLFVAPEKMSPEVAAALGNAVRIHQREDFEPALAAMAGKRVVVDPERAVAAIFGTLEQAGATVLATRDPTVLPRAIKNDVEIKGQKAAQARDGAALTRFLNWFEIEAPKGGQTELSVAAKLEEFRRETGELIDLSFPTISGAGPNGALCHYKVDEESNRAIETGTLYLVDSGGQYRDGTTDVTRTMPVGEPTAEMVDRFTRVLQGHIALARAVFPEGTNGGALDTLARQYLWQAGLDYAHGTGHGVGAFLSVHEGPARIAKANYPGGGPAEPLRVGMFLSNEPGYYKAHDFGIRIENLVLVEERKITGAEEKMLGFETLTFAPIERRLIDREMLSAQDRAWLDSYHADVLRIIGPQVEGDVLEWLKDKCAPI